jgi:limonene-1,2-epoxide hydrolase
VTDRLEIVRRSYHAFNQQDFDTALTHAHPEIEYVRVSGLGSLVGPDAWRAFMQPDAFADLVVTPIDIEVSGDMVFVRQRAQARGAGSGIEMDVISFNVWTFDEDDLVIRVQTFLPREEAEARRVAGLAG